MTDNHNFEQCITFSRAAVRSLIT